MNEQEKAIRERLSAEQYFDKYLRADKDFILPSWAIAFAEKYALSSPPAKEAAEEVCPTCGGSGTMDVFNQDSLCVSCNGSGKLKKPLTDEQLQKDNFWEEQEKKIDRLSAEWEKSKQRANVKYPTYKPKMTNGRGINKINDLQREAYLSGVEESATPLQALLKEKAQEIRELKWQLNDAKVLNEQKEAEIERLKELSNLDNDLADNDNSVIEHLRKQLTELKEENERLKAVNEEARLATIDFWERYCEQEREKIRALHTQQMEEAIDYMGNVIVERGSDKIPVSFLQSWKLGKSNYLTQINNQKHSI